MKNKIQNTLVYKISMHIVPWILLYFLPKILLGMTHIDETNRLRIMFHINAFLLVVFFYLNKYVFVPKILSKQKFILFGFIIFFSLIFSFVFTKTMFNKVIPLVSDDYYGQIGNIAKYIDEPSDSISSNKEQLIARYKYQYNNFLEREPISNPLKSVIVVIAAFAVSTSLTVTKKWYQNELQKQEMAKEKFETELMFLKSQVNPHFLFNTLNGIYSLANKKSDETPGAVVKLSSLIRYMLYDSNKDFVDLEQELDYIKNYIDLQSIRLHKDVDLKFRVEGNTNGKLIAPMLLIPFIENAFKHGIDYTKESHIDIKISVDTSELKLKVVNSINQQKAEQVEGNSGVGLKNVKRRLEMVYPNNHLLHIDESTEKYKVTLTLILDNDALLGSR